jgi:Peptidase S46
MRHALLKATLALMIALSLPIAADEGMWLFTNPPLEALRARYKFEPDRAWLEHLQKASVRFNNGGSGSFISPDGLAMTNHHVASDVIQKLSTKEKDYMATGFHARTREEELRAHDLELNVLMEIEDVTARVRAAVQAGLDPAAAQKARQAVLNTIEKESLDKTGMRSDVVTLYNGGQYHLYRYKRYTDVRLVFAPERAIAFLGGDPDNFEFPRYNLDVAFFRAYENGKPAKIEHYLNWSRTGAKEGDLVFVSGHPGRTERMGTVRQLQFLRDLDYPMRLNMIRRREVLLRSYADSGTENARRVQDDLLYYQNSRKARTGMLAGLQDASVMNEKRAQEAKLREAVAQKPELARSIGDPWESVAASIRAAQPLLVEQFLLERGTAFDSQLFDIARTLVRLAEELAKPNPERLREYGESRLESLRQQLFSEAPVYSELEIVKLSDSLTMMTEMLGAEHELVKKILDGKSPRERAAALIEQSKLADVAVRKKLAEGGKEAVRQSQDAMIALALLVDPAARAIRKQWEESVDEPQRQAYGKIADARFQIFGTSVYPDATFTLRLAFGQVKEYTERGRQIPFATTLGGAFEHADAHQQREPFAMPKSWLDAKSRMKLDTPFNFVSTPDIIGGNSGSPVVNRQGELVGIIFDGNIYSLVLDFLYTTEQARAIAVHSAGILEALRGVYKADALVKELTLK